MINRFWLTDLFTYDSTGLLHQYSIFNDKHYGKVRPLGSQNPNAVKFFSAVEFMASLADRGWLDEATKTIGQYRRRKNTRRSAVNAEKMMESRPRS